MNKTHKKILGLAGLGLVAAVTTFAATVQVPGASAVSSVSDQIQVRVLSGDPEITITPSVPSGGETTDTAYSIKIFYNKVKSLTATLVNKAEDGTVLWSGTILDKTDLSGPDEMTLPIDLSNYNGYGTFTITVTGTSAEGVPVQKIVTVTFKEGGSGPSPDDDGKIVVPDTGGSATGLNISREDYLITGLIVFATLGVLAFWLVKRKKNNR